jgi:hypothetical protein
MPTEVNSFKAQFNERRHHNNVGVATHLLPSDGQIRLNPDVIVPLHPGSIVPGDKGRYHYPPMHSQAKEWKVCMRQSSMARAYGSEADERGKKPIPQPERKPDPAQCKKMIVNDDGSFAADRRGSEIKGLCVGFKSLKHFETRKEAPEYDMETYMNKKQRAGESLDRMRNGIRVAVPGDRPFKCAEHEPGYYAKGGLIPGSSIQLRKSAKPERRPGEATTTTTKREKKLSYAEKQRIASEKYDLQQVAQLTQAFERQGNEVPSFEQRTGTYLVKPEDEAY